MQHDPEMPQDRQGLESHPHTAPSADFINAISEFFDTDPNDLLVELGYYKRDREGAPELSLADMTAQQE